MLVDKLSGDSSVLSVSFRDGLLGFEFLDEFEATTSLIREAPLLFTEVDPPIRRALVRRFPYGVFYLPGSDGEADTVVAVVDLRRDPEVIRHAYRR